jgi:hypothetical protein
LFAFLILKVLAEHYQRASAMKHSLQIEEVIEEQLLSTPASKKVQASIRNTLLGKEPQESEEDDELMSDDHVDVRSDQELEHIDSSGT